MSKKIFSTMVILAIIAAAFFSAAGTAQAEEEPSLSDYAGIAAYTDIGPIATENLEAVKSAFLMIEYETTDLVVGTLDLTPYEADYDPLVLVTADGDIVAFYLNEDPAGKLVDVISKNLDETLLEKAVKIVADAAGVEDVDALSISHYDFGNEAATKMLLVAEHEPDGNAFTLQLNGAITSYQEKSYAFYRTFAPSFTLDNDTIDQVDFVEANADYLGLGYYGTIYGDFEVIDFIPGVLNTFAVEAGDHLGFGALAILYDDVASYTVADKDFEEVIDLVSPGPEIEDLQFDLTPSAFAKVSPEDEATGVELDPTLSWTASTAPNYEYCIDTVLNSECDTEWISTGSLTYVDLSNLYYDTTYYWQVQAVNSEATVEADDGDWGSFTTADGIAPETFSKLTTELTEPIDSLSKVTMTWTPSYGAYYYEVCVDTEEDCTAPELWHNVGLATTATIGDLLLDTEYYWQVRAWNGFDDLGVEDADYYTYADGESAWQLFETRTFGKLRPLPDEVYNLTLPFKWEETPIATDGYEYCVYMSAPVPDTDKCDNDNNWINVTGTSVVVNSKKEKLDAGTYYWQVRALPDEVEANGGDWWEFEVLSRKDLRKINLFKVSPLDGAVDQAIPGLELTWDSTIKTSDTHAYEYCFFPVDDTDTTPISDDDLCQPIVDEYGVTTWPNWISVGIDTSKIISGLLEATTYYWQVRAILDTGTFYADNGDYWAFTTP